jgi:hypothetical protein
MLRLKKPTSVPTPTPVVETPAAESPSGATPEVTGCADAQIGESGEPKVSLIGGIGGMKVGVQKKGKRRTPGEIRVQKGE